MAGGSDLAGSERRPQPSPELPQRRWYAPTVCSYGTVLCMLLPACGISVWYRCMLLRHAVLQVHGTAVCACGVVGVLRCARAALLLTEAVLLFMEARCCCLWRHDAAVYGGTMLLFMAAASMLTVCRCCCLAWRRC
eukprot:3876407-Rhodomonas_salina.1